jgi:hypothetical protein
MNEALNELREEPAASPPGQRRLRPVRRRLLHPLEGYLGQTIGRKATGIRVVTEATGTTPGVAPVTVRTVLRLVDGLFSYLVAFITTLTSSKRQRLGDMAANTLVVRV